VRRIEQRGDVRQLGVAAALMAMDAVMSNGEPWMQWWKYRFARMAGQSVLSSLAGAFEPEVTEQEALEATKKLVLSPDTDEPTKHHAKAQGIEILAKREREHRCMMCGDPLKPNQVLPFCLKCEKGVLEAARFMQSSSTDEATRHRAIDQDIEICNAREREGRCTICGCPLKPNQATTICEECEKYKFE
jgi:hypothetical protein